MTMDRFGNDARYTILTNDEIPHLWHNYLSLLLHCQDLLYDIRHAETAEAWADCYASLYDLLTKHADILEAASHPLRHQNPQDN